MTRLKAIHRTLLSMYNYSINPLKLVVVNPRGINFVTKWHPVMPYRRNQNFNAHYCPEIDRGCFLTKNIGLIVGGDWDSKDIKVDDMPEYRSMSMHILEGVPWLETPWSRMVEKSRADMKTVEEYRRTRPAQIKKLIDSMQTGFVACHNPLADKYFDNVNINIARDGTYLFEGGFHRFCISRILGLKEIRCIVNARHALAVENKNNYNY